MKKTIVRLSFSFSFAFSSSITQKIGICGIDSTRRGLFFSLARLAVDSTLLFLSMTISDKQYRDAHNKSIYHRTLLHLTTVCLFLCVSPTTCQIDDARLGLFFSLSRHGETIVSRVFFCNERGSSAIIIIGFSHSFIRLLLATHSVHVRGPVPSRASVGQNKLLSRVSLACLSLSEAHACARDMSIRRHDAH